MSSSTRRNVRRAVVVGAAVGAGVALGATAGRRGRRVRVRRPRTGGGMLSAGITLIILGLMFAGIGWLLGEFLPDSAADIVFIVMIATAAFFGGLGILFFVLGIFAKIRFVARLNRAGNNIPPANNARSSGTGGANHCRNCGAGVAGASFCQSCGSRV